MEKQNIALTEKEERFVDAYIETLNATESARRAGMGSTAGTHKYMGSITYHKPHVQKAIQARLKDMASARVASATEVLEFLTAVMRNDFEFVGHDVPFSAKERIQSAELLGKRYALFTDKTEQSSEVTIDVNLTE